MANLLSTAVYVTAQDVIDTTQITELKALTDTEIERYITEAQYIIDSCIGNFPYRYEEDQNFIFPIKDENGNSYIPDDIKIATIYIVEDIYLTGVPTVPSGEADIKREDTGDHEVEFFENSDKQKFIPDKAKNILDRYGCSTLFYKSLL